MLSQEKAAHLLTTQHAAAALVGASRELDGAGVRIVGRDSQEKALFLVYATSDPETAQAIDAAIEALEEQWDAEDTDEDGD